MEWLQYYSFWKEITSLQAIFGILHMQDSSWLQSYPILPLPATKERNSPVSQVSSIINGGNWGSISHFLQQLWVLQLNLILWSPGSFHCTAGADAMVLTLREQKVSGERGLALPSDDPSPARVSPWASRFYQFPLFRCSSQLHATPFPTLFQVSCDSRKLNKWLPSGIHLEIPPFSLALSSDQEETHPKFSKIYSNFYKGPFLLPDPPLLSTPRKPIIPHWPPFPICLIFK